MDNKTKLHIQLNSNKINLFIHLFIYGWLVGQDSICFFGQTATFYCVKSMFCIFLWPIIAKTITVEGVIETQRSAMRLKGICVWRWPLYLPFVWLFQHCSSSGSVTSSSTQMLSGSDDQNFFDSFNFSLMSITWSHAESQFSICKTTQIH